LEEAHKEQDDRGMRFFEIASDLADDVIKQLTFCSRSKKAIDSARKSWTGNRQSIASNSNKDHAKQ
jgi:hypothetical protein